MDITAACIFGTSMTEAATYNLSGALYYPIKRKSNFWSTLKSATDTIAGVTSVYPGWIHFIASPHESWIEPTEPEDIVPKYDFWARKGREGRVLIVSTKAILVKKLLQEIGLSEWVDNTPTVDITGLVEDLMAYPRSTAYSLGAVWARIKAYGQSLRTIVLYGDDLASASIFSDEIMPKAFPYRVTLRKYHKLEVLSISDKGDISFSFKDTDSLLEVDRALSVISKDLKRVEWNIED